MKVLIAVEKKYENSYIDDIVFHLNTIEIDYGVANFFNFSKHYNVIHIHWPEALCNWNEPDLKHFEKIDRAFKYWKKQHTKIVYTMHNDKPHFNNTLKLKLYDFVLDNAHGIIHLGNYSYDLVLKKQNKKQVVIPHSMYENLPNDIDKPTSRKLLGIPEENLVVLCFGAIRNQTEYEILTKGFKKIDDNNKTLVITKFPTVYFWKKSPLKRIQSILFYLKSKKSNRYFLNSVKSIKKEDIQIYLNAADIVFIPRYNALNSGNLLLGFTYGKVVVGPDIGNIGALLKVTKNPSYDYNNLDSIKEALEKAIRLNKNNHGKLNYEYADKNWNLKLTAHKHLGFYNDVLNNHHI